ncbi:hypothetical protein [Sphingopyxis fribergensis]
MKWIKNNGRRRETDIWGRWLGHVPSIRRAFAKMIDDDPLLYNETASVGVLASAASRARLLALPEYIAVKRGNGRGRPHKNGRCDLWLGDPVSHKSWAFEFKQIFCPANPRTGTIAAALDRAMDDIHKVHPLEADRRFGGLFVSGYEHCVLSDGAIERIEALAKSACFACRFEGGAQPVYLILKEY